MSEHAWAQDSIAAFVAGGLDVQEAERLETHVRECPLCSSALDEARTLDRDLDVLLAPAKPGPALEDRMIRSLHVIRAADLLRPRWKRNLIWGVAASVGLGITGASMTLLAGDGELPFPGMAISERTSVDEVASAVKFAESLIKLSQRSAAVDDPESMARTLREQTMDWRRWNENPSPTTSGYIGDQTTYSEGRPTNGPTGPTAQYRNDFSNEWRKPGGDPDSNKAADYLSKEGLAERSRLAEKGQKGNEGFGFGAFKQAPPITWNVPTGEAPIRSILLGARPEVLFVKPADPAPAPIIVPNPVPEPAAPRKIIIRSGDIEFEIESFDSAYASVVKLVAAIKNGYVADSKSEKLANGKVKGSIVVRVPPESLDGLVLDLRRDLGKGGELKGLRIGSQDITKQYTDIESRLKAARTMEKRLLKIIEEGKGEIKQLLEAEKELGVWRTKIEEMEGELRFFGSQVSLSTLTIALAEKEIKAAAGVTETERVQAGIEVEDVEKAQQQLLASVADAKGRVTKSELKQHGAGQLSAAVHFEVAPEQAGPLRDRLRQLGLVTRLQIDRLQHAEGGTALKDAKVKRGETVFELQLYNVAKLNARETTTLQIAATDVPAAFRALQDAVARVKGRVLKADLNEQDRLNVVGQFAFEVRRADEPAIQAALAAAGDVSSRNVTRAEESESSTDSKVRFNTTLQSAARLAPRETIKLAMEVGDVDQTLAVFKAQVGELQGRIVGGHVTHERSGQVVARLVCDVPLASAASLAERFKSAGTVKSLETIPNPQAHDGKLGIARVEVILANGDLIIPKDDGVGAKVRQGVAWSVKYLLLSVSWLIVGLLLILPWGLVGYAGYRVVRRLVKAS